MSTERLLALLREGAARLPGEAGHRAHILALEYLLLLLEQEMLRQAGLQARLESLVAQCCGVHPAAFN